MKELLVIAGPTAVGKSELAFNLAKKYNGEIINADSVQIYKELNIGSSKPPEHWFKEIPHHLFDYIEPDKKFTVFEYMNIARKIINEIYERGNFPIVVGGTGLYIRGLLHGIFKQPESDNKLREKLKKLEKESPGTLHRKLMKIDPELAKKLHPHDIVRIIRGIEVWHLTGKKMSEIQKSHSFSDSPYNYKGIFITKDETTLKENIKKRTKSMLKKGLINEVEELLKKGYSKEIKPLQSVGYKETVDYLDGKIKDLDELEEAINRSTWRLVRRQRIWFKKEKGFQIIENDMEKIEFQILNKR